MIDTIANLLFRCPHSRLTRPITPVSKPGVPSGETYVVCLNCGKQFYYDWKQMRMGRPIDSGSAEGVLRPDMPKPPNTRVKYALLGAALPFAVMFGKALASKRKPEIPGKPEKRDG
ncbi:MAG: hypothetical protein ACM336_15810 [Acidobacteriota bacterium]